MTKLLADTIRPTPFVGHQALLDPDPTNLRSAHVCAGAGRRGKIFGLDAVDLVYRAGGAASVYTSTHLEHCLRDSVPPPST